ncbi:MAG: thermonuclease [Synergistaceae bacterium]|nr:thermonuclease family protein [Synergistota bacterium]NLM70505.1 thermonuclease [Synergistaceae bacterium]
MRNLGYLTLALVIAALCAFLPPFGKEAPLVEPKGIRVLDGDTIKLDDGGETRTIRYLLIDTPELHHPSRPVEELGREALLLNNDLLKRGSLRLEFDRELTDRYGRSLAYLFVDDGGEELFINEELVRHGVALPMIIHPNRKYADRIIDALNEARLAGRGLWHLASPRIFTASQAWSEAPCLAGCFITLELSVEKIDRSAKRIVLREGKTALVAYKGPETEGVFSLSTGDRVRATGKLALSFNGCELPIASDLQVERISF